MSHVGTPVAAGLHSLCRWLINDVCVLVKPLAGLDLVEYLERMPRDRPDSTPP